MGPKTPFWKGFGFRSGNYVHGSGPRTRRVRRLGPLQFRDDANLRGRLALRPQRRPTSLSLTCPRPGGNHRQRGGGALPQAPRGTRSAGFAWRGRWRDGGPRCRAVDVPAKPERRLFPAAPLLGDTGISSATAWVKLNHASPPASRLVSSCYASRLGDPKGVISRILIPNGFQSTQRARPRGRLGSPGNARRKERVHRLAHPSHTILPSRAPRALPLDGGPLVLRVMECVVLCRDLQNLTGESTCGTTAPVWARLRGPNGTPSN